jgi:hypothetical protein
MNAKDIHQLAVQIWIKESPLAGKIPDRKEVEFLRAWIRSTIEGLRIYRLCKKQ